MTAGNREAGRLPKKNTESATFALLACTGVTTVGKAALDGFDAASAAKVPFIVEMGEVELDDRFKESQMAFLKDVVKEPPPSKRAATQIPHAVPKIMEKGRKLLS